MANEIKHENRDHALLSASASHRWLNCPASVALEANIPGSGESEAAREGTAAHELAEYKCRKLFKMKRGKRPHSEYEDEDMDDYTDGYMEYAHEIAQSLHHPNIWIEQRVDYSAYAPGGFGTADMVFLDNEQLHILDFKYGKGVLVMADDNPQLKLYALGVLDMLDYPEDLTTVVLHIYQPRRENVSEWSISVKDLVAWGEWVKPIADEAYNGSDKQCAGEWCQFCKVQAKCRARAEEMFDVIEDSDKSPTELTDEEIDDIIPKLESVEKWIKAIFAYAQAQAMNGKEWKSVKLVRQRSNRKYVDEAKVADTLQKLGYTDIYTKKLLSITEMEKLLGKKNFGEILKDLVVKPEGNLTLVMMDDRREAVTPNVDYGFKVES